MTSKATSKKQPESNVQRIRRSPRRVVLPLSGLRTAANKTQMEISLATGINQANISRLESLQNFDDCQVSTLRRYVEALGGELRLAVVFPVERRIEIIPTDKDLIDQ